MERDPPEGRDGDLTVALPLQLAQLLDAPGTRCRAPHIGAIVLTPKIWRCGGGSAKGFCRAKEQRCLVAAPRGGGRRRRVLYRGEAKRLRPISPVESKRP